MSNIIGTTCESSCDRSGSRVDGVPRRCWCKEKIELKLSKSENNPYHKFLRCSFIVAKKVKLKNNKHVFKWMDEAILSEIESLDSKIESLHKDLNTSGLEIEKMQRKFESDILRRVETHLIDAKAWFKKLVLLLIIAFLIGCISFKILP